MMFQNMVKFFFFSSFVWFSSSIVAADHPLKPVLTHSPEETVKSFLDAMNSYKKGIESGDQAKIDKINDAIRTFDLSFEVNTLIHANDNKQLAILLKEVLDRVFVFKSELFHSDLETSNGSDIWRVPDTEITVEKIKEGDRKGEFLFSRRSLKRVKEFYKKVQDLPYLPGTGKGALYKKPWLERHIPEWSEKSLGLQHWQWFTLILFIILSAVVRVLIKLGLFLGKKVTQKSLVKWDDKILTTVEKPLSLLGISIFWFFGLQFISLEGGFLNFILVVVQIVFSYAAIWLAYRLVDLLSEYMHYLSKKSDFILSEQLVPMATRAVRLAVVIFGVLIAVQNLGVNVMSLIAGLGLGGLAFALAFKDTAANLFGSIMILLDQPFKIGDWVRIDSMEGTVEEIGFRSTRIRTFYNSQICVPNFQVANAGIDNLGRRQYRRAKTTLGLTYDTTPKKMQIFIDGIKKIILSHPDTRKDYFHVVFNNYGAYSLDIMLYFFFEVKDWADELKAKEEIYFSVYKLADEVGVSFAFPTQTLHVDQQEDKRLS